MKLYFVLLMKSHLISYPCPLQINYFWNYGFLLAVIIISQLITGIFLSLHYSADISTAYYSIFFLIREVSYGWCLRYFHSNGASFVFLFLYLHIARSLYYGSYFYITNTFISGILLLLLLMAIAFLGYVLPYGQMSFWGATVITNLLSPFPNIVEFISGSFTISNASLHRFFIFHFLLPFVLLAIVVIHIFYLHYLSSNNPLNFKTNNKIPFFPSIIIKDSLTLLLVVSLFFLQSFYGLLSLSHPDNSSIANSLITPLHIVPEWYFLLQYAMLKAIPNKNSGFIILLTSILILFFLSETRNLTTLSINTSTNNKISITFFFITSLMFFWIGAQFPQEIFLSYSRILTLYYYFLLSTILLTLIYYYYYTFIPIILLYFYLLLL